MRRSLRATVPPLAVAVLLAGPSTGCDDAGLDVPGPPVLVATPELRIGSVDDPATLLTHVGAMDVLPDGRIYSAHRQEAAILVHGPDGRRLARIGGEGEGPGEFQGLRSIGFLGDTLWAFDLTLYRASYFAPDGELLRTLTLPVRFRPDPESPSPPRPYGVLPDGRILGTPPAWSHEVAAGTLTEVPTVAMDTLGNVLDTLYVREPSVWAIQNPTGPVSYGSYRPQPFADQPIFAHSPRDPAYVVVRRRVRGDESTSYRVTRITFAGDTVFDRTFAYDPIPIDPAYPDSLVGAFAAAVAGSDFGSPPGLRQATAWARENLYVPAHYPPVDDAVVGLDGTTWLRLTTPDPGAGSVEWMVLDATGEPLGRVALPGRFQLEVARRDRVWGSAVDELDVPYIVRYRIRSPD